MPDKCPECKKEVEWIKSKKRPVFDMSSQALIVFYNCSVCGFEGGKEL